MATKAWPALIAPSPTGSRAGRHTRRPAARRRRVSVSSRRRLARQPPERTTVVQPLCRAAVVAASVAAAYVLSDLGTAVHTLHETRRCLRKTRQGALKDMYRSLGAARGLFGALPDHRVATH